ncbi:Putative transcriptional regulatory protein Rxt2 [Septoria linicola]|uniref:Transcriptional regulatory protein Rxt2 n=1 Tax=Septoria linicola TaxID=215465 RepID=A0A9Q9EQX4_9PEZI|nr:Putative transcriptional regulatory protein Rxt2 [Septoria linicola]
MAAQQQHIMVLETIRAMKVAMKRRASDSDSDTDLRSQTNRGNKLRRNAKNVQEGRLDNTGGLAYKKKVTHAGYTRHTIAKNPAYLDEDGDAYSPTSSDHENERYGELAEDNPYAGVQLDTLLRPLTSAAELADHPSLSIAYKSTGLTQMADEACEMLRRERARLWKAKRLLQRFRGDADWVPAQTFEEDGDGGMLGEERPVDAHIPSSMFIDHAMLGLEPPTELDEASHGGEQFEPIKMLGNGSDADAVEGVEAQEQKATAADGEAPTQSNGVHQEAAVPETNGDNSTTSDQPHMDSNGQADSLPNPALAHITEGEAGSETASQSNGTERHAMTTRARARSPAGRSDRTPSPSPSDSASSPVVHPWFVAPTASLTDRDLGLPAQEAEETRKLLLLYVQKQEQVVRSLDSLHAGLQRADRLRSYVHRSCKAEGHVVADGKGNAVTEMSDGEDWYDVTDWNLQQWELKDGKLEKGKDEVEDVEEERGRRPGRGRRVNRI